MTRAGVLLAAAACIGCGDPGGSERSRPLQPLVDTVDGVVHVWNPAEGAWAEGEAWSVEEVLRLGALRGPREELFSGPQLTAAVGPDGAIYVQDYQAALVSVFSPEGEFIRHIGGPGLGPGEFSSPSAFTWDALGRLWVGSFGGRYTVFSSEGEFLRTQERPVRALSRAQQPLQYLPEGALVDVASSWPRVFFVKTDTAGAWTDTLGHMLHLPISDAVRAVRAPQGSDFRTVVRSYLNRRRWALAPDQTLWIADNGELRLAHLELGGDTVRVIHTSHRSVGLSASEERMVNGALRQVGLEWSDVDVVRPILQQILVMDDGHVLVQIEEEVGEDGRVFDVFHPEGRYLGALDFGFAPTPLGLATFRGDTILAPTVGLWDVPYIVKAVIHRPEAGPDG